MMTTKTIISLLKNTLLSLVIVILVTYIFGIFASGIQIKHTTASFIKILPLMIPFFLVMLFSFYYMNHRVQVKNQTNKAYSYFLYTVLLPALISGVFEAVLMYILKEKLKFFIFVNHLVMSGAILLFFALFYFIKYNYSNKNKRYSIQSPKTPYNAIILYAIGLSILNCIGQSIILFYFTLNDAALLFTDSMIIAIICWFFVHAFNRYVNKKKSFTALIAISIILIVICMLPIIIGINYIQMAIIGIKGISFNYDLIRFNLFQSIFVIFAVLFYQLLYLSKSRTAEQKAFKAEIGKQTEKYESLRRQLSPHFLFNNINVLTALIEENPQKAVRFSESLGNIYRHFLRQEDEDVVSLESALSFSKDYLELLKYRYEDAFRYNLPEKVTSNHYIIPLALQQVIENAIKHNEVSNETPLQIAIEIQDDYLIVQNTKQLKKLAEVAKGTGIENIKSRYVFLTEKEVIIEDLMNSFTIKLPLLNMENS